MNTCELDDLLACAPEVAKVSTKKSKVVPVAFDKTVPVTRTLDDGTTVTEEKSIVAVFLDCKSKAADYKALEDLYGGQIKTAAEPLRAAAGRQAHELVQTIDIGGLRYTAQDKFSEIKAADLPAVSAAFGPRYGEFIVVHTDLSVSMDALVAQSKDETVKAAFVLLSARGIIQRTRRGVVAADTLLRAIGVDDAIRAKAESVGLRPQISLTKGK